MNNDWYMWAKPGEFEIWWDFMEEYGETILRIRGYLFTYSYEEDDIYGMALEFEEHFAPMNFEDALERWQKEERPTNV